MSSSQYKISLPKRGTLKPEVLVQIETLLKYWMSVNKIPSCSLEAIISGPYDKRSEKVLQKTPVEIARVGRESVGLAVRVADLRGSGMNNECVVNLEPLDGASFLKKDSIFEAFKMARKKSRKSRRKSKKNALDQSVRTKPSGFLDEYLGDLPEIIRILIGVIGYEERQLEILNKKTSSDRKRVKARLSLINLRYKLWKRQMRLKVLSEITSEFV
jgi:hypothetical protein